MENILKLGATGAAVLGLGMIASAATIVWSGAMGPNMVQLEIQVLTSKEGQSAIRTAANAISPFIGQANAATRLAP